MVSIISGILFIFLLINAIGCAPRLPLPKPVGPIKVCLSEGSDEAVISSRGSFNIISASGMVLWRSGRRGGKVTFSRAYRGDEILAETPASGIFEPSGRLTVRSSGGTRLKFMGKSYHGHLEIRSGEQNPGLTIVNAVNLEEYLKGVLPSEMGKVPGRAIEALKAQAIVSRTYAYMRMLHPRGNSFDLYGDVRDQVYGGASEERDIFSRAIEETEGIVVAYEGKPVRVFFFSCCGGHTAAIDEVWDVSSSPSYLTGVSDSLSGEALCKGSWSFGWREIWSADELNGIVAEYLPMTLSDIREEDVGTVEDILVEGRSPSGRILALRLVTSRGDHIVRKDKIRWVLRRPVSGNPILRSTLFTVTVRKDASGRLREVEVAGRGNGHGVGMCQHGAIGMAKRGFSALEILAHYYPGTSVEKVDLSSGGFRISGPAFQNSFYLFNRPVEGHFNLLPAPHVPEHSLAGVELPLTEY